MRTTYRLSESAISEVIVRYQSGESSTSIAKDLRVDPTTIQKTLKRKGVPRRSARECHRSKTLDESVFDRPSAEKCYWIGFLMADGTVISEKGLSPKISVGLRDGDLEHLIKLREFLKSNHKISHFRKSVSLSIRSKKLVEVLEWYGIRSDQINGLQAERNFWRGVVDADGKLDEEPTVQLKGNMIEKFEEFCRMLGFQVKGGILIGQQAKGLIQFLYGGAAVSLDRHQRLADQILS